MLPPTFVFQTGEDKGVIDWLHDENSLSMFLQQVSYLVISRDNYDETNTAEDHSDEDDDV